MGYDPSLDDFDGSRESNLSSSREVDLLDDNDTSCPSSMVWFVSSVVVIFTCSFALSRVPGNHGNIVVCNQCARGDLSRRSVIPVALWMSLVCQTHIGVEELEYGIHSSILFLTPTMTPVVKRCTEPGEEKGRILCLLRGSRNRSLYFFIREGFNPAQHAVGVWGGTSGIH